MRYASLFLTGALVLTLCLFAQRSMGQSNPERTYTFAVQGLTGGMQEKQLLETVVGFEPEARVVIDRELQQMAVRTYRTLDLQALQQASAYWGITLTVRHRTDLEGAIHTAE